MFKWCSPLSGQQHRRRVTKTGIYFHSQRKFLQILSLLAHTLKLVKCPSHVTLVLFKLLPLCRVSGQVSFLAFWCRFPGLEYPMWGKTPHSSDRIFSFVITFLLCRPPQWNCWSLPDHISAPSSFLNMAFSLYL